MSVELPAAPHDLSALVAQAWDAGRDMALDGCAYGPANAPYDRFVDHPLDYHRFLAGFAKIAGLRRIIEIGTHYGGSAIAMVHGMRAGGQGSHRLVTLDTVSLNPEGLAAFDEIVPLTANGADPQVLAKALAALDSTEIDLLYIDALKDGAFVAAILEAVTQRAMPRFVILDDIAKGATMPELWRKLDARFPGRTLDLSAVLPDVRKPTTGFGLLQLTREDRPISIEVGTNAPPPPAPYEDRFAALRAAPWQALPPAVPEIRGIKGMMRPGETRLLNWLATHFYRGEGEIVDAGPFLGRSTIALASGVRDNSGTLRKDRRIHSYDLFETTSESYRKLLKPDAELGGSFLDEYMEYVAPYSRYVNVYPGDLTAYDWIGAPIEILFVDIAKSVALNAHVYATFAPHLIPGRSIYVQQDYVHLGVPAVHTVLGFLIEHFEVLDVVVPSLVLATESVPPRWKLDRILADDFSPAERVDFIERLEARVPGPEAKGTTLLVAACLAADLGMARRAAGLFERVLAEHAGLDDKHYRNRIVSAHKKLVRFLPGPLIVQSLPW